MRYVCAALVLGLWIVSPPIRAEVTIFPPYMQENCTSAGAQYLSWYDGASQTYCSSGQDILRNAIPTCSSGQYVALEGTNFVCKSPDAIPTCGPNEFLSFNGGAYSCDSLTTPTCGEGQVLTTDGSSFTCVDNSDNMPTCEDDEFLTYNGTAYQCASGGGTGCAGGKAHMELWSSPPADCSPCGYYYCSCPANSLMQCRNGTIAVVVDNGNCSCIDTSITWGAF